MIEWTFNITSIITIILILVSGVGFYWRQVYDSRQFKEDIVDIKLEIKALSKVLVEMALQTERMNTVSKRLDRVETSVDELRHLKGFVS